MGKVVGAFVVTVTVLASIYGAIGWMVDRSMDVHMAVLNAQAAEFDQRAKAMAEQQELMRQAIKTHEVRLRAIADENRWVREQASRGTVRRTYAMEITAYTCDYRETGKWPGEPAYCQTAAGLHLKPGHNKRIVAADPRIFPAGTRLMVEGIGEVLVSDTGSAIKGMKLDLFWDEHDRTGAMKFGRQLRSVTVLGVAR